MMLRIDLFRADTMWLIEKLGLYLDSMEAANSAGREEDRQRIDRMVVNSQDDFDDQQEELHKHKLLFEEDFPSKLRYSFLVMSYILFESRFKALSKELRSRKVVVGKEWEKKESFTKSVRRFFESEPNKLTFIKPTTWSELSDFNAIRNCIVHRSGDVNNSKQRVRVMQVIHKNKGKGLSLTDDGFLQVDPDYCRQTVEVLRLFFHAVFEGAQFGPEE